MACFPPEKDRPMSLVPPVAARHKLGIPSSRFAKLLRLGFIAPEPNGLIDLAKAAAGEERAARYEARVAAGEGQVLEGDHRDAIAAVLDMVREELAGLPIAAGLARVEARIAESSPTVYPTAPAAAPAPVIQSSDADRLKAAANTLGTL